MNVDVEPTATFDELLARWLYSYMAQDKDDFQTEAVFKALADPTRRRILRDLKKAQLPAGEIASHFPISGPSVSRHLSVLKAAGLVTERRQANQVIYSLAPERLAVTVGSFLSAVCPDQLPRPQRKKKTKAAEKGGGKEKGKVPAAGRSAHTAHAANRAGTRAKVTPPQDNIGSAASSWTGVPTPERD